MSVHLTARVWAIDDPELKDARLLTLLALADFGNKENMAWASVPTLSKRTRVCDRQVQRSIQWLDEQGYIKIVAKGNGRGNLTAYEIVLKGDISTPFNAEKGDTAAPFSGDLSTADSIKGDIANVKGDIGDENYSHVRREPIQQPTTEGEEEIAADAAPPVPVASSNPKRSRKSQPPPPNTSGVPPPREPTEWQEFVGAFCWLCHGHKEVKMLTNEQRGALMAEAKLVHDDGYAVKDLREWYKRIWPQSWQWKKDRSRPKPSDVRSSVAQLRASTPEGFEEPIVPTGNHVNGTSKVAGSLAALDDYDQIKLRHGVST